MGNTRSFILILAAGAALHFGGPEPAAAQSIDSLVAGTRIRLWSTESPGEFNGTLVSVSADSLLIRMSARGEVRDTAFFRRSLMQVEERVPVPRDRAVRRLRRLGAVWGGLLGGAFGAFVGLGAASYPDGLGASAGTGLAIGAVVGGAVGWGIGSRRGAASPGTEWRRVF